MTNISDNYHTGEFLRAYLCTLTESFEHVYLFGLGKAWEGRGPSTYIAVASPSPLDLDKFRERIGLVTQDAQLFSGSIRENLLFVRPGATDAECLDVMRQAACDSLLARARDLAVKLQPRE